MRVLFSSTRGAGHLQPLLPYARALVARDHQVAVAAPADVSETLREAGLTHAPFDHPGEELLSPIWVRLRGAWSDAAMAIAAREIFAGVNAVAALPKLQQTIRSFQPDLLIRDSVEFAGLVAAEQAGVRHARVAVHSVSFEEALPALVEAPIDALRALANLAPDEGASLRAEPAFSSFPASLDAVSPESRMQPPVRARVADQAPSSANAEWAAGADPRPLVYITFGTLVGSNPHTLSIYRTSLDAVADLPVRVLLTTGGKMGPDVLGTLPANVRVETWVPQREVLPHAAVLVCHGGSGTLLGGLAAGLPLVIVPFGADQPHNAQLVATAGAGLALNQPNAVELRVAIQRALDAPELRQRARRFAMEIAAMPTIDSAVEAMFGTG